jgi:hypothetical protein
MMASLWIVLPTNCNGFHCLAESLKTSTSKLVERVDLDWDHSGKPTRFALSTQLPDSAPYPDSLTIQRLGIKPFLLRNKEGGWGKFETLSPLLKHRNMVSTQHMFFIAAGTYDNARIYLILIGEGSGCCVGSVTVLTPDKDGIPLTVFHENQQLLYDVRPLEDSSRNRATRRRGHLSMPKLMTPSAFICLEIRLLRSTTWNFQRLTR